MRLFEKGKVSIITPCYNGGRFLDRYFDALCKQTYDNVELIFVNDARSSDNSEKICLSWKSRVEKRGYEFRYILQKKFKGVAGAINEGLPYVTGEFFIWPDCDDPFMPASIEKRVDFLTLHPDYALVRSGYVSVNENNPEIIIGGDSDYSADGKNEDIFDDLVFDKTFPMPGSYMVRSSVFFERIPKGEIYWENEGGQNWQILLPCTYKNKTGFIDEPLYTYYYHPDSHSNRIEGDEYSSLNRRMFRYREILFHVINDFDLLSDEERTDYLRRIEIKYMLKRLGLALLYNKSGDAMAEMQKLRDLNFNPGIQRKILCQFCNFGLSGFYLKGYTMIYRFYRKIR
jgi:glycosyltransferase involved in cell wall biosynthesis